MCQGSLLPYGSWKPFSFMASFTVTRVIVLPNLNPAGIRLFPAWEPDVANAESQRNPSQGRARLRPRVNVEHREARLAHLGVKRER